MRLLGTCYEIVGGREHPFAESLLPLVLNPEARRQQAGDDAGERGAGDRDEHCRPGREQVSKPGSFVQRRMVRSR